MPSKTLLLLLFLAGAAVPVLAFQAQGGSRAEAAPRSGDRACFLPRTVTGFHAVDRDTIDVTVGPRNVYRLELLGTCPDVDWATRVGIRSTHGATWVCQGEDAEIFVRGATGIDRCPVTAVRKLSAEEIAAERAARKKKR